MSEVEFNFRARREVEEPLYLDLATREPPRRRRRSRAPLVLGCVLAFLLAAGAGAYVLGPPAALRDALGAIIPLAADKAAALGDRSPTPEAPGQSRLAAPAEPPPANVPAASAPADLAVAEVAAAARAAAAEAEPQPAAPPQAKAPSERKPHAARAATPKKKPAAHAKLIRAAAPKKPAPHARPAPPPASKAAGLDLDALERSLKQ